MVNNSPFSNPHLNNTELTHTHLIDIQDAVETRNLKKIQSSLSAVSIILECPKPKSEIVTSDADIVYKLINSFLEYIKKIEIYKPDDPRFELAFQKVILLTHRLMKKLGLKYELPTESEEEIDEMDSDLYLKWDERYLDTSTQKRLIEKRKKISEYREELFSKVIWPDIEESLKKPGCRKFDKNFLKIRDKFVQAINQLDDDLMMAPEADLKAKMLYVDQMDLLLVKYRDFMPYKKILDAIRDYIYEVRYKLAIGIAVLENNYQTRIEKIEFLKDLRFLVYKFNGEIQEMQSFLEDDFFHPDSEKCVEYYYESFLLYREDYDDYWQRDSLDLSGNTFEDFEG